MSLPGSVTHIEEGAFWGCSALSSVEIPNSVTYIGRLELSSGRMLEIDPGLLLNQIGGSKCMTDPYLKSKRNPLGDIQFGCWVFRLDHELPRH